MKGEDQRPLRCAAARCSVGSTPDLTSSTSVTTCAPISPIRPLKHPSVDLQSKVVRVCPLTSRSLLFSFQGSCNYLG